jgi:uncharacterized protein (TIGR03437 family)
MNRSFLPVLLLLLSAPSASAIVTLGASNQNFTLTGIGANSAGQGQSLVGFGSCSYDGTNTTCTVSGPYTGFNNGSGTYSFVVTYAGNGQFPLIAVNNAGNNLFSYTATNNFSLVITLTPASGTPVSFYSFANFDFYYSTPACTGVPAGSCSVSQVGATQGATITGPITGTFDPTPTIRTSQGVIGASGYGGFSSVSPGDWVEIYGVNLATILTRTWAASDFTGTAAPQSLAGTSVTVGGLPAYVLYVSPGQANVQVPSGIGTGLQPVVVTTAGGTSLPYPVNVNIIEPGLLAIPSFIVNGNQNVVALFSNTLTYVFPTAIAGASTARAKPGNNITLYGIGFGTVTPNIPAGQLAEQTNQLNTPVSITFGGVSAVITYQGLGPDNVGLYQFNVVVPNVPASDTTPVAFTIGNVTSSQSLVIAIAN